MSFSTKIKQIFQELKIHSPFTLIGAATGIIFMLLGRKFLAGHEQKLFAVFHPLHVLLSAMVTAALFEIHRRARSFMLILIVGVVGSIGIATLSDCVLPFFGETILGVAVPTHASLHETEHNESDAEIADDDEEHVHGEHCEHEAEEHDTSQEHVHGQGCGHSKLHLGFIEEWYLVFPAAILGVLLAYFFPHTKYPHGAHVLFSTWASSSHILMNTQAEMSVVLLSGIFIVLFLAVWLPCCVSDIVFPLLFVRSDGAHVGHSCCFLCGKKEKESQS